MSILQARRPTPTWPPHGRLSLTTALSVTVSDVTAAATVYYTPHISNRWQFRAMAPELSLALDSNAVHTNYHQSGKNFDFFLVGPSTLGTGPAWTSDTGRGSGAGTTELVRTGGIWTNANSMTLRTGANSGDTITVAAGLALYVGSARMTANGQTEDSAVKRFLWNMFNRVPRKLLRQDTTDNWTYSTATIRQANGSAANQVEMLRGLNEDNCFCLLIFDVSSSGATVRVVNGGIGLDSTTARATDSIGWGAIGADNVRQRSGSALYSGAPGLGYHYLAWLEVGAGADTQTWYGDNGVALQQSGLAGECFA